jgi:hypothetical protein
METPGMTRINVEILGDDFGILIGFLCRSKHSYIDTSGTILELKAKVDAQGNWSV